nr:bifunctional 4-hydroxy-2-oxoglutarate aldolase/2-dehydro-3-deoxy-phosphogluconate aldolase [Propionibacterium sp.]
MSMLDLLRAQRVVGIIRGQDTDAAIDTGRALFAAGIGLVEVSLTTPRGLDAIAALAADAPPQCLVGAGTVLTPADVAAVAAAGARFVVTPALTDAIAAAAAAGLPVLGGALTPSEVLSALREGAVAVKLFPASSGGPAYLKALRDPFPHVPFVPVGGVDLAVARAYLRLGAIAVGVGGPLVGDAASGGDLGALTERAAGFAALAKEFA